MGDGFELTVGSYHGTWAHGRSTKAAQGHKVPFATHRATSAAFMPDSIRLSGLSFDCIVGVYPHERDQRQAIVCDLTLELDLAAAGRSGRISATVDYSAVALQVRSLVQFRRYRLLEAAAEETCAMLFGVHDQVTAIRLELHKPQALTGEGLASVTIERKPEDYPRGHEITAWGEVDVLLETRDAGLYLLNVAAGSSIPNHHHRVMRELEWLVSGSLWRDGQKVALTSPVQWGQGRVHGYENRSNARATLFCCDVPPFIPEDEIKVEVEP